MISVLKKTVYLYERVKSYITIWRYQLLGQYNVFSFSITHLLKKRSVNH